MIIDGAVCFIDGPDAIDVVYVDGKAWHFEFHERLGPTWLKADKWTPRKCQCPKKSVWVEFEKWMNKR